MGLIQLFSLAVSAGSAIAVLYFILKGFSEPEETANPILSPWPPSANEPLIRVVMDVSQSSLAKLVSAAQAQTIEQAASPERPKPSAKGKLVRRVTGKDEEKSA